MTSRRVSFVEERGGGGRRRHQLMRSSSTGTGLKDYAPAATGRYLASSNNRNNLDARYFESKDDIGVKGVKPRVHNVRGGKSKGSHSSKSDSRSRSGASEATSRMISEARTLATKGVTQLKNTAGKLTQWAMGDGVTDFTYDQMAAWNTRYSSSSLRVAIQIQCRNLPRPSSDRQASAFCVLWHVPDGYLGCNNKEGSSVVESSKNKNSRPCALPRRQEHEIGRSEVIHDSSNPIFQEIFKMDYHFEEAQTYLIRVYGQDASQYSSQLSQHDYLGGLVFQLGDLMARPSHKMFRALDTEDGSRIIIAGRELEADKQFAQFRLAAEGLVTSSDTVLGMNGVYFMLERRLPQEQEQRESGDKDGWETVWKSDVVMHSTNPMWQQSNISVFELCKGNLDAEIRISFWETFAHLEDENIGRTETTVSQLLKTPEVGSDLPIFVRKKFLGTNITKRENVGRLIVVKAEIVERPTFLQYLKGGCEIDLLVVAVDCGDRVDHKDQEKATHFLNGKWWNHYQACLSQIGSIMESYSKSCHFQMLGFNAQKSPSDQSHYFTIDDKIAGKRGLLKAYERTFVNSTSNMTKLHESHLAPLIGKAIFESIERTKTRHSYTILCILMSGSIDDAKATADAIQRAATDAPLSILFIECEPGNKLEGFQEYFAKHKVQRSIAGIRLSRDDSTFISFQECGNNPTKVVSEALRDVPEHLVQRLYQQGIDPKPPPKVDINDLYDHNIHKQHVHKLKHGHKTKHRSKSPVRKPHHGKHPETERERSKSPQRQVRERGKSPQRHRSPHRKKPT